MAFRQYLIEEVVLECADGAMSRREALHRLGLLGVVGAAATALMSGCGGDDDDSSAGSDETEATTSASATDAPGDEIRFAGPRSELIGVFAEAPEAKGAVLVIHENRGLTAHIRSIPGRLGADGYSALAIDLLSEQGGTASMASDASATAALGEASVDDLVGDLRAGLDELERRAPDAGLAVIGFCFGGGMTWQLLAAGDARISAAVPFYGPLPAGADFAGSPSAAVLGVYAELDDRVNASREDAEAALDAAGLEHDLQIYDGVDHAFFNDSGSSFDADAAASAYAAMIDWFDEHLA